MAGNPDHERISHRDPVVSALAEAGAKSVGSGGRGQECVSGNDSKELPETQPGVVPTMVPDSVPFATEVPPDLAKVIGVWPRLSEPVKTAILTMVQAVAESSQ